jgi:hypothetical protein
MKKEESKDIFIPYKLYVETLEDHNLLIHIIEIAIDTYDTRSLNPTDFEYVKKVIEGD